MPKFSYCGAVFGALLTVPLVTSCSAREPSTERLPVVGTPELASSSVSSTPPSATVATSTGRRTAPTSANSSNRPLTTASQSARPGSAKSPSAQARQSSSATLRGSTGAHCPSSGEVQAALRQKGLGAYADGAKATCSGDWVLLTSAAGDDNAVLLRKSASGLRYYSGFPTDKCRSAFLKDGGAGEFASHFPAC